MTLAGSIGIMRRRRFIDRFGAMIEDYKAGRSPERLLSDPILAIAEVLCRVFQTRTFLALQIVSVAACAFVTAIGVMLGTMFWIAPDLLPSK